MFFTLYKKDIDEMSKRLDSIDKSLASISDALLSIKPCSMASFAEKSIQMTKDRLEREKNIKEAKED